MSTNVAASTSRARREADTQRLRGERNLRAAQDAVDEYLSRGHDEPELIDNAELRPLRNDLRDAALMDDKRFDCKQAKRPVREWTNPESCVLVAAVMRAIPAGMGSGNLRAESRGLP
ncbi:MAG: hypothetical protein AB7O26_06265 [Planctomycetaceae bacterium]